MAKTARARRIAGYIKDYKGLFALGFIAVIAVTAGELAYPLILRAVFDADLPRGDHTGMLLHGLLYIGVAVVTGFITYFQVIVISRLGLRVVTRIKQDVFEHLLTLPVSYFDTHPVGELMARTESDSEKVKNLFSEIGISLAFGFIYFAGVLGIAFYMQPFIATCIAIVVPILLVAVILFYDRLRVLYDKSRKFWAGISASVTEFVQGSEILRAFNRVEWAEAVLDEKGKARRANDVKTSILEYAALGLLNSVMGPFFTAAIIIVIAPKILLGVMTLGTLLAFFQYSQRLLDPFMAIAENVRSLQQARVSLNRILDILSLEKEGGSGIAGVKPRLEVGIEFRNVWFRYKEDEWVLEDVSFTIPRGSTVALVGPSGSGKTTTVGLLCRFYRPQRGEILIDGVPIEKLDLAAWRHMIGLVLQDVYLFPGSVLENVRVYDDGISADRVSSALGTVQASDFVASLTGGLDAEIRERGSNISSGEKQLLSFARAVAFDPQIVVLDEATASIDVKTERRIRNGMAKLLSGKTALVVAHRLSSVMSADAILFFKDGRIAARGRHDELMAAFPEYADLVHLQFPKGGRAALDEAELASAVAGAFVAPKED